MKLLNRAQVLGAKDQKYEDVATPEWAPEGTPEAELSQFGVRIRNLTASMRGVFIQRSITAKQAATAAAEAAGKTEEEKKAAAEFEVEALLVTMTAVDDKFIPVFTMDDLKALGEKSAAPVSRCAEVAQRLSGLFGGAEKKAVKP